MGTLGVIQPPPPPHLLYDMYCDVHIFIVAAYKRYAATINIA